MANAIPDLISNALAKPKDAIFYTLSRSLSESFPDLALLETEEHALWWLQNFAKEGHCTWQLREGVLSEFETHYDPRHRKSYDVPYSAWVEIDWQKHSLQMVSIGIAGGHCREMRHYLLAGNREVAEALTQRYWKGPAGLIASTRSTFPQLSFADSTSRFKTRLWKLRSD